MKILISEGLLMESPKVVNSTLMSQAQMEKMFPSFSFYCDRGVLMEVPISAIEGLDPTPATWTDDNGEEHEFEKGHPIPSNKPIEVWWEFNGDNPNDPKDYDFMLQNGNHRIRQAIVNGATHIRALVDPRDNYQKLIRFYGSR